MSMIKATVTSTNKVFPLKKERNFKPFLSSYAIQYFNFRIDYTIHKDFITGKFLETENYSNFLIHDDNKVVGYIIENQLINLTDLY